ncbi:MAG: response regulator, partial [Proteobacteria bacterium]|nr:response regulator [Pseudomonadota bacterium]
DFNNLLAVVLGNSRYVHRQLEREPELARALEDAVDAAESAARLTRQLLAYAGRREPDVRPVDLSEQVNQLSALLESALKKKVFLRFDLADDLPRVQADVVQLEQVMMNLVLNAGDAMRDSEGEVVVVTGRESVSTESCRQWIGAEGLCAGEYAYLEVRDQGRGMDTSTQARIFDPFFTTKELGHGLGLSAVLGLVRGHGGGIVLDSEPGRGTCLRIYLPVCDEDAAEVPTAVPMAGAPEATVMVADDEPAVRRVVNRMLSAQGMTVIEAQDGRDAIDQLELHADDVDLLLLDLNMPKASGPEVLDALASRRPDLPVLLTSGYDESEMERLHAGAGPLDFIEKPYTSEELVGKIRTLLDKDTPPARNA